MVTAGRRDSAGESVAAPRRYGLVTTAYPGFSEEWPTGGATYARRIVEALTTSGWTVDVILAHTADHPTLPVATPSVQVVPVRMPTLHHRLGSLGPFVRGLSVYLAVRRLDRTRHYAAIEAPNILGIGWLLALRFGRRFFLRMHTSTAQDVATTGDAPDVGERASIAWGRLAARHAGNLVTHSRAQASAMAEENGIPIERIDVIPHATPSGLAYQPLKVDRFRMLYVGGMTPRKGIDLFVHASKVARERHVAGVDRGRPAAREVAGEGP